MVNLRGRHVELCGVDRRISRLRKIVHEKLRVKLITLVIWGREQGKIPFVEVVICAEKLLREAGLLLLLAKWRCLLFLLELLVIKVLALRVCRLAQTAL